ACRAAVHQGTAAHRNERRLACEYVARGSVDRHGAAARRAGRLDGSVLRYCVEDFQMAVAGRAEEGASADHHGDLSRDDLLRGGARALEWIGSYLEHPERYPVLAQTKSGEIRASIPAVPPTHAESLDDILNDFESKVLPGITHWNHPAFFGY